ncbi:MAG: hypothetical protein WCE45_02060 [Sedimentisphaerales bacterium]
MNLNQRVELLCKTAKTGLSRFYPANYFELPYTADIGSEGQWHSRGASVRYAAISQIGIAKWLQYHYDDKGNLPELWPKISDNFKNITDIGDITLSLWAGIQSSADDCEKFARALKECWPIQSARCNAVELGWVVQACLMVQQSDFAKISLKSVLDDAHKRLLLLFDADARLFYRHHRPGLKEMISRHISCFADQVYPIVALSNYGFLCNHHQSIDFAAQATEKICQYQGELGQWWWHYDVTHKRICEQYPVFSVHQDGMAPMAIMASDKASKQNHSDKINLGLRWDFGFNEMGENIVHPKEGIIWRDIERNEPAKLSRKIRSICSVAGLDKLHHLTSKCINSFRVNQECRPYHLGWILYAWADHKAISD